jgi:hypothetical protein
VIAVISSTDLSNPPTVQQAALDDVVYGPSITAVPSRRLTDGDTVAVSGSDLPAGGWTVAECARTLLDDPTPARAATLCGPSAAVVAAADGSYGTDLVVHDPLAPAGGDPVACGAAGCVVALLSAPADPAGSVVANTAGISFGATTSRLEPDHDLKTGMRVRFIVDGSPRDIRSVRTCLTPVGPQLDETRCGTAQGTLTVDDTGHGEGEFDISVHPFLVGGTLDCRADPCALVGFDAEQRTVVQSPVLDFAPAPSATLTPSSGLLDGQAVQVSAADLLPERTYQLFRCPSEVPDVDLCVGAGSALSTADGTLTGEVTVGQRIAHGQRFGYCRAQCNVVVAPSNFFGELATVPFAMATGSLAAAPSTGLSDGQTVQVTGADLMPSYAGPNVWIFPTGGWALTQCDRAILDDPSLGGALLNCAAAPVTQPVDIPGSTLASPFTVHSTITKILGGTTDCAAAPNACVVGLVRLEQDASLSTHLAPLTFTSLTFTP